MPLDRNTVTRGARQHIRSVQELQRRQLSDEEKRAIRAEHERIAQKVADARRNKR